MLREQIEPLSLPTHGMVEGHIGQHSGWVRSGSVLSVGASLGPRLSIRSHVVEVLEELMRSELDILVTPLRGPVLTGNQARPMDAAKVPINECVSGLRIVAGTFCEPQMPLGVLIP